ncbi:uncharacterized protein B0H18DRAFT_277763 [Fomitopsis serialis]|uniref:uncharacterized protein n=1 Tax=Fomitopsis serialis TaxID=139415 RepID=UPI002007E2FF|nr:uncharacterized protein B0H18DRAFT_277763 [Neoantrodia serialis]KAH9912075.1 hypothetical protein B0H18DRAFT_277763 [Neoantrodia serialis]
MLQVSRRVPCSRVPSHDRSQNYVQSRVTRVPRSVSVLQIGRWNHSRGLATPAEHAAKRVEEDKKMDVYDEDTPPPPGKAGRKLDAMSILRARRLHPREDVAASPRPTMYCEQQAVLDGAASACTLSSRHSDHPRSRRPPHALLTRNRRALGNLTAPTAYEFEVERPRDVKPIAQSTPAHLAKHPEDEPTLGWMAAKGRLAQTEENWNDSREYRSHSPSTSLSSAPAFRISFLTRPASTSAICSRPYSARQPRATRPRPRPTRICPFSTRRTPDSPLGAPATSQCLTQSATHQHDRAGAPSSPSMSPRVRRAGRMRLRSMWTGAATISY